LPRESNSALNTDLNPPSLAESAVEILTGDETSERLGAFCTATKRAPDLPAEFR